MVVDDLVIRGQRHRSFFLCDSKSTFCQCYGIQLHQDGVGIICLLNTPVYVILNTLVCWFDGLHACEEEFLLPCILIVVYGGNGNKLFLLHFESFQTYRDKRSATVKMQ